MLCEVKIATSDTFFKRRWRDEFTYRKFIGTKDLVEILNDPEKYCERNSLVTEYIYSPEFDTE